MSNKFKNIVKNTVDEIGYYETKKLMGISFTKLAQLVNDRIPCSLAYEILIENIANKNLPTNYEGFKIYNSLDGVVYWGTRIQTGRFLPDIIEHIDVVATPFWDGDKWTPVELDWYELINRDTGQPITISFKTENYTWFGKSYRREVPVIKYKDEQTTGIVYATNSTHDVYIVKHISNDAKKQGMIGTIQLSGKDIIDTKSLIEKETLQNDSVVYYFLQKLNNLTSSIKASRRISSKSPSRRTSSKSPSRMTQRILPSRKTPAEMISARYAGYRKTRRNRRRSKH
jgi:hypothetical protein